MLKDRTKSILEMAIKEYIRFGEPITSENLYETYDFGIKPAMIRLELNQLDESGFLSQVHSSGGRLPTDKAYRFFVQNIIDDLEGVGANFLKGLHRFENSLKLSKWESVVEDLSDYLGLLSVGYETEFDRLYRSGLEELFDHLDLNDKDDFLGVIRDFDLLEDRLDNVKNSWKRDKDWPKVFVGENPITKSKHLSLVAQRLNYDGETFFILAIGPKRMNYEKPIKLFKNFCDV